MRLGILRMVPKAWDPEYNFKAFEPMARKAAAEGVEVLVTCECFLDGYSAQFGTVNERFTGEEYERFLSVSQKDDSPYLVQLRALCKELHMGVVFGYSSLTENGVKNTALFLDQEGEEIGRYHKTHWEEHDHDDNFVKGDSLPVFDTKWGRVGLLICADRRWPEAARTLRCKGAQILLIPTYGGRGEDNTCWMRTRAFENEFFLAFCHPTISYICNPQGYVEACLESNVPGILVHDIDLSQCNDEMFRVRRTDLY